MSRPHRCRPQPVYSWHTSVSRPTALSYIEPLFHNYLYEKEADLLESQNVDFSCDCYGCSHKLQYETVKQYSELSTKKIEHAINGEQWRLQELERLQYLQATNPLVHRTLPELVSDRTDNADEQLNRCRAWIASTIGEENFVDPFTDWPIQSDEEKFKITRSEEMELDDATESQVMFLGIDEIRLTRRGQEHMEYHIPDADPEGYEAEDGYNHVYYNFTRFPFAKNCLWNNMALLTGIANQAKMAVYDGVNFKPG